MNTASRKRTSIVCFLLFLAVTMSFGYTGEVITSFSTPGMYPTGLTFDGKNLWLSDRNTDKMYSIDPKTGNVLHTLESPAYWPMGLAWDGEYLWSADIRGVTDISENLDGKVFQIDPKSGNILRTLQAPSKSPRGLAWDGKYLWCADDVANKIIQFSTADGTTIRSFPSPSGNPEGMCFDGKYLWISDRGEDEIYMVDPETGYVILIMDSPGPYPTGLSYDGKNLWAVDYQNNKIYKLKVRDEELFRKKDERTQKVIYSHKVENFGPGKILSLDVHIALPEKRDNQILMNDLTFNRKPDKIVTDKWGQKTAYFHYENVKPGKTAYSEVTSVFKTYNVRYFIYPEKVGRLDQIPTDIKEKYLDDDEKYQLRNPLIQQTVKEVVGNETNAYWIVRKIHQYLIERLYYLMDGAWDTAPTVLRNGHGSCSEYTFSFIALCRAAGLPTRYVGSTWNSRDEAGMDDVFHRWIEVYLPNYGWIPTDPTHGDRESPRDQAFPIGLVRNSALITTQSGGGSETMGWTYNSNEFYTTEPKTNLTINFFSDWEPVK